MAERHAHEPEQTAKQAAQQAKDAEKEKELQVAIVKTKQEGEQELESIQKQMSLLEYEAGGFSNLRLSSSYWSLRERAQILNHMLQAPVPLTEQQKQRKQELAEKAAKLDQEHQEKIDQLRLQSQA